MIPMKGQESYIMIAINTDIELTDNFLWNRPKARNIELVCRVNLISHRWNDWIGTTWNTKKKKKKKKKKSGRNQTEEVEEEKEGYDKTRMRGSLVDVRLVHWQDAIPK